VGHEDIALDIIHRNVLGGRCDMEDTDMRTFDTGATRSPLADKPQYEGYLNPLVIKRFGEYMLKHQTQADGQRRDADNWQKGIPPESLIDSVWRHLLDVWLHHRGHSDEATEPLEEALCAVLFNTMALLLHSLTTTPPLLSGWRGGLYYCHCGNVFTWKRGDYPCSVCDTYPTPSL
jgi:hypothetical protein